MVAGEYGVYFLVDSAVFNEVLLTRMDLARRELTKDSALGGSPFCLIRSKIRTIYACFGVYADVHILLCVLPTVRYTHWYPLSFYDLN